MRGDQPCVLRTRALHEPASPHSSASPFVVLIFSPGLVAAAEDEPFHARRCGLVHSWHHALVGVGCERVGAVAEANLTGNYT